MDKMPGLVNHKKFVVFWFALLFLLTGLVSAYPVQQPTSPLPGVFLTFDEGSGSNALDSSGYGDTGTIVGGSRAESGCGKSLIFDGSDSYVRIPFTSQNHPDKEISVSLWFFTDALYPQTLISSYQDGGYRLGFGDGQDLWWTVNLEGQGDISLPVHHESISLNQWHYVTGTYDGNSARVYLDGVLRSQVNATGTIHYQYPNSVILGADAGTSDSPDKDCPEYFQGGLDEVRIYNITLTQGQIIDERLRCSLGSGAPPALSPVTDQISTCDPVSGSLTIIPGLPTARVLRFDNKTQNGTWAVRLPAGSTLVVNTQDLNSLMYPDAWYIGIDGVNGKVNRGVVFPNTNNAGIAGMIPSENASVTIRYFDGPERFPSTVRVLFDSIPPQSQQTPANIIMSNPIIVIYSASWVTLIALVLVMVWLHVKNKSAKK